MRILKDEGSNIDAVSPGEIYTALLVGFKPEKILYTGNNVTNKELELALCSEVRRNRTHRGGDGQSEHAQVVGSVSSLSTGGRRTTSLRETIRGPPPPKHASWLNIAECELSVLGRQCLSRRLNDQTLLEREVAASETRSEMARGYAWTGSSRPPPHASSSNAFTPC